MKPNSNRVQATPAFPADILGNRKTKIAALAALPETALSGEDASESRPSSNFSEGEACIEPSSSCGDCEGHVPVADQACPSLFRCGECSNVLHELSNVMTGVLTNAQLLGWKLPPYSHLKRRVRELERGAQRSGELLKRLRERCPERPGLRDTEE